MQEERFELAKHIEQICSALNYGTQQESMNTLSSSGIWGPLLKEDDRPTAAEMMPPIQVEVSFLVSVGQSRMRRGVERV